MRRAITRFWILAAITSVAQLHGQSGSLIIENQLMRISVFAAKGGLNEIIHKPSGVNLRSKGTGAFALIWDMKIDQSDGTSFQVSNSDATTFKSSVSSSGGVSTLDLTWTGLAPTGRAAIPTAIIHVTIALAADGSSTWKWDAQGLGGRVIENVTFPHITGLGPLNGKDDIFIVPNWEGRILRNPTASKVSFTGHYPSSFMNMQFMALSSSTVTFALRTQDSAGYNKAFSFNPSVAAVGDYVMQIVHDQDLVAVDRLSIPYDLVLTAFTGANGDWTDAAEDYKKWAYTQSWVQQASSRSTPAWLSTIAGSKLVCGTGCANVTPLTPQTYAQDIPLIAQDEQLLGGPSLVFLEGWEKFGAWYYGDYFPPQEGFAAFDAAMQAGKQKGIHWWPIPTPAQIVNSTDLWKSGKLQSSAILDSKGNLITELDGERVRVWMDPSASDWEAQVVSDYTQLAQHGVDFIQLDGFPRATPACYDSKHGHPLGAGGNWQTQAYRKMVTDIRNSIRAANPDAGLSSEGGAEVYLPWIDLYFSRDSVFESFLSDTAAAGWEVIPLFEYLYHPLEFFVGSEVFAINNNQYSNYQLVGLGRTFVWGQIPNYYTYPPSANRPAVPPQVATLLQKTANARLTFANKYLLSGTMLPPPLVQTPTLTTTFLLRDASNRDPSGNTTGSGTFPAVQFSAWKAPDGSIGIVFANTDTKAAQIQLPVNFKRLTLDASKTYTPCLLRATGATQLAPASAPEATYTLQLDPQDVGLIELSVAATCQQPGLNALVNGATFKSPVAPGSLVSIFGTNFPPGTDQPSTLPLPTTFRRLTATVNNIEVPLLFLGPNQINAQLPSALLPGGSTLIVRTDSGIAPLPFTVAATAPGILIFNGTRAVAVNPDGSINDPTHAAAAGDFLTIYLTGIGPIDNPVTDGFAATASPLSRASLPYSATLDGTNASIPFLGLAPGFVGLAQANVQVPKVSAGDHSLVITVGGVPSNGALVTVK